MIVIGLESHVSQVARGDVQALAFDYRTRLKVLIHARVLSINQYFQALQSLPAALKRLPQLTEF